MNANDNPRPWKKDVTKGEWGYRLAGKVTHSAIKRGDGSIIVLKSNPPEAELQLIAEAGTVLHQTGMTPGELAERVRELEDTLWTCINTMGNARAQIEYLHRKFQETGSGNGIIAQLDHRTAYTKAKL